MPRPVLIVVAGPNGAGKSTLFERVLEPLTHLPFVNADRILAANPTLYRDPYAAGRAAAAIRDRHIANRRSFVTETVFSHPSKVQLLADAAAAGYITQLHVVVVPVELAVARVAQRVAAGGHDVPEEKIRSRYAALWSNVAAAAAFVDELTVYDNSGSAGPTRIAQLHRGTPTRTPTWPKWAPTELVELTQG